MALRIKNVTYVKAYYKLYNIVFLPCLSDFLIFCNRRMEQCSKKCKDSSTGIVEGPIPLSELWSVALTLNKGDMVHFKWRLKSSNGGKADPWQEQQGYVRYVILDGGDDPGRGQLLLVEVSSSWRI